MLSGDNGLLTKTGEAKDQTIIGQEREQVEIAYISAAMNKLGENVNETDLQKELDVNAGEGKTLVTDNYDDTLNVLFYDTKHNFTVEDNDISYMGIIPDMPEDAVARINTTFYTSLQEAINAVEDNKRTTVFLLKDISENVTILENKNIFLNLSNHTLTNFGDVHNITVNGKLYLKNGYVKGIYSSDIDGLIFINKNAQLYLLEEAKLKVEKGTNVIINEGILNVSTNSEISSTASEKPTIYNKSGSKTTITGGTITSTGSYVINNSGELEINGTAKIEGTASGKPTIYNNSGSKTTITGGTITSTGSNVINNFGELEINGTAKIEGTASEKPTICNNSGSKTTITGGIIKSTKSYAFYNQSGGTAIIIGGTFISTNSYAIYNSGTISVNGATINGMTYGI